QVERVAVRRVEWLPLLILINLEPHMRLQIRTLANDEARDESRWEAQRSTKRDHRPRASLRRPVFRRNRSLCIIGKIAAAGGDIGAVLEDPLQPLEFGLSIIRSQLSGLTNQWVGRRQINLRPQKPVSRFQRFERRPIAVSTRTQSYDEFRAGLVRRAA